jgi:hypothetical protein
MFSEEVALQVCLGCITMSKKGKSTSVAIDATPKYVCDKKL